MLPEDAQRARLSILVAWGHIFAFVFLIESLATGYIVVHDRATIPSTAPTTLWPWAIGVWIIGGVCVLWALTFAACRRALSASLPHYASYTTYAYFCWFTHWALGALLVLLVAFGQSTSSSSTEVGVLIVVPIAGMCALLFYLDAAVRFYQRLPNYTAAANKQRRRQQQRAPVLLGGGGAGNSTHV
jgi:hypothetical protein